MRKRPAIAKPLSTLHKFRLIRSTIPFENLRPNRQTPLRQPQPVKPQTWINLPVRRQIRMPDHPFRRDAPTPQNPLQNSLQPLHLRLRKGLQPIVLQFNSDGVRIHILNHAPTAAPRMPGPFILCHHPPNPPIRRDNIMRRNLKFRCRKPLQRGLGTFHPRIVQNHHIRRPTMVTCIEIRRRVFQNIHIFQTDKACANCPPPCKTAFSRRAK